MAQEAPKTKTIINRAYLSRDFESMRSELLRYARVYFPDKIQDFSEASVGGLLLDMAAMVGDTMSFYLDHQFRELDPLASVEIDNVINHMKNAGVDIVGAAPSTANITFFIEVPADFSIDKYIPRYSSLPVIQEGTTMSAENGTSFVLIEDVDFSEKDKLGLLKSKVVVGDVTAAGIPSTFILMKSGTCVAGNQTTETFAIANTHTPFQEIVLSNENITTVISVSDSSGNNYYEVDSLSHDTVFVKRQNFSEDSDNVESSLEVIPAPHRFVRTMNPSTRLTTLRFGSGDSTSTDDDIIPDPSMLSLPLYGRSSIPRFSIDPNLLLKSKSLGVSPRNTSLSVRYRHGGGLNTNASSKTITSLDSLRMIFRNNPSAADALQVRQSIDLTNEKSASGGDDAPTISELQSRIPNSRLSQTRMVTKEDLLARIYTLPSEFGRVFRAGVSRNLINPLSINLYICSRDINGHLTISPDTLKRNIAKYLNEFRLLNDAIDILDAQVVNFGVKFNVVVRQDSNKETVIRTCLENVKRKLSLSNFQIDQPILLDDIVNVLINTKGVVSLLDMKVFPISGIVEDRTYNNSSFNFEKNTKNRAVLGARGSIFEMKFPEFDIIGNGA